MAMEVLSAPANPYTMLGLHLSWLFTSLYLRIQRLEAHPKMLSRKTCTIINYTFRNVISPWRLVTFDPPNLQRLGLNFQPPRYALQILQVPPGPDIGAVLAAALFHRLGSRNAATIAREPWGWWDRELMPIAAVDTLFRELTTIFFNFPSWMNLRSLEKSSSKTFDVFWDVLGNFNT